jgi:signal transduction histidine kinase
MYSNILKDESTPDSQNFKDLELIAEQAERCKKIVGGLLNFARKNQVKSVETNMVEFCEKSMESILRPDEIHLEFISNIENPIAWIDQDQMNQVLTNLMKNAVEAMNDSGHIKLILSGNEDKVNIEVNDNGSGISQENMNKIFTPFFTTKGVGKGTGLGLPLIYGIVKMHKGNITVTSNSDSKKGGTGTTFKIVIPRKSIN